MSVTTCVRPEELEEPDIEELKEDFTPKQRENWEEHGKPIFENLEDETAKNWFLRLQRPKKQGCGMMDRDHVKTGAPEKYLRESISQFERPRQSFGSMIMASVGVDDEQREELDDVAVRIVAAKAKGGILSDIQVQRILEGNKRVAEIYGVADS
ncbi:hypothetical protein [Halorhabdus rudnickae]|uniref:hypothetical protein n=1 Tax=Halorhabdus rudnickae TaxID=1775544 RepID=UPI001082EA32|nr:hypothetical protein [Halorhabdus rudnickae]